jgi:hypothetical protein
MSGEALRTVLMVLHWIAGLITVAEALNKLERTAPCRRGLPRRERATEWLKAAAWSLLAIGGAWAVITPLMHLPAPDVQDVCFSVGFAILIVRTRVKEG